MNASWFDHELTDEERSRFDADGYLVIENALPEDRVESLLSVAERLDREHRASVVQALFTSELCELLSLSAIDKDKACSPIIEGRKHVRSAIRSCVVKDPLFLDLLDFHTTFPKVWSILGYNIQLHLSRLITTPPCLEELPKTRERLQWHQDGECLNIEIDANPRPRISLKVGYFLTDTTEIDCGNLYVVPGSHLKNELEFPADGTSDPPGAVPLRLAAGGAVILDRRLWHSPSPNYSNYARTAVFYGYSYRWVRQRDEVDMTQIADLCDPIRRQLLGAGASAYATPREAEVPLREWLEDHENLTCVPVALDDRVPMGQRADYDDKPFFI